ncbi:SERTA domain-containing protein 2 isoform X2 [Pipistrellus kuhlii]|uniref:SERTA domain-containing protein 2 isoform X2 n=1 Tax=Pipistrellus kuhlii TaxID=59472 RepID=UPI001E274988|nr:SERTA domain-containing protein 2 isoform X2 [Pipistrellus kuhlii]
MPTVLNALSVFEFQDSVIISREIFMLGKGGKRKFDEHEDGLEGKILSPSDGPSKVSYTLQRQTIFNISLMKLYQQRPLSEPSLQRTVLINNMLRRIQEELRREGSLRPAGPAPAAAPAPPGGLGGCREAPPPAPGPAAPPGDPAPLEACLTPASLLEDDGDQDTFCTSPAAAAAAAVQPAAPARLPSPALPPEKDSFSSALDEIEELCPTPTSAQAAASATLAAAAAAATDGSKGGAAPPKPDGLLLPEARPDDPKLMDSLPGNFEVTTSTGFLTDLTLDDILFADIDTSMYDFDPCTSAAGAASKVAPVSADDLLKTLAPYSSQPVAPSQPFKMDLTELDHIMEANYQLSRAVRNRSNCSCSPTSSLHTCHLL